MRDRKLRDLIEPRKTVSRKQQSRVASGISSVAHSRLASTNASRHGSDDEAGDLSDGTAYSTNSIDDFLEHPPEETGQTWDVELGTRIEEIINRKRSTNRGRELCIAAYNYYLMSHYCHDEIEGKTEELYPAFFKSTREDTEEKEACLALRAIALTIITVNPGEMYDTIYESLKRMIDGAQYTSVKAGAIRAISTLATYGGAAESEIRDLMDVFLEIVETDGSSADALDSVEVVAAACEEWGALATVVDDLEDQSDAAVEAFVGQLESSSTEVQIAAGENIALIAEKSYSPREQDDEAPGSDDALDKEDVDHGFVKRYEPFRRKDLLIETLTQLTRESSKSISKKDRKSIHSSFRDVLATVEHPTWGPKYQPDRDPVTGLVMGSRMTVRIQKAGYMKIDKWWKLIRLQALKRTLGGGFITHYQDNAVVFESLPAMLEHRKPDPRGMTKLKPWLNNS
ncbi:ifrd domain protein [Rutstroemia sp. NJR-2017a WRK4]|nr:ifrd domain protein [Rutstroemia sp. NJR-2017a WRK4]